MLKISNLKETILVLLLVCFFASTSTLVSGEEPRNVFEDFSWEVIYPDSQKDKQLGYYDLQMKPGDNEVVQIKLSNSSDKELTINIDINPAKTNEDGSIEYGNNQLKNDSSLKHALPDIVKNQKSVKIPANDSVITDFKIDAPKEDFDGIIAGGIQLTPETGEAQDENKTELITNKYTFVIGLLVRPQDKSLPKPDIKLNRVYQKEVYKKEKLFINFSNTQANYIDNMNVQVEIKKSGKEKVLLETGKTNMRMAPNSVIDFPINLDGKKLSEGSHILFINVEADGSKWSWTEKIEIKKTILDSQIDIVSKNDKKSAKKKSISIVIVIILFIILFISLIGFILYILVKRNKKRR